MPIAKERSNCLCNGSGQIKHKEGLYLTFSACDCRVARNQEELLKQMPPRYRDFTLKTLKPRDERQRSLHNAMRKQPTASYLLMGSSGVGKTTMAAALFHHMTELVAAKYITHPYPPLWWVSMSQLQDSFRRHAIGAGPEPPYSPSNLLRLHDAGIVPHLFIDECDKSRSTEFALQSFADVITTMEGLIHRQLVITSNMDDAALADFFGSHIARRLVEMAPAWEHFTKGEQ